MYKSKFIDKFKKDNSLTHSQAEKLYASFTFLVSEALKNNEQLQLTNFGRFKLLKINERIHYNPKTRAEVCVPAHYAVKFTPGKTLKDLAKSKSL